MLYDKCQERRGTSVSHCCIKVLKSGKLGWLIALQHVQTVEFDDVWLGSNQSRAGSEGAKIRADESNGNQTHVRKIHISGL